MTLFQHLGRMRRLLSEGCEFSSPCYLIRWVGNVARALRELAAPLREAGEAILDVLN